MKRSGVALIAALIAASANAFDYKRWLCSSCAIYPVGTAQASQAPSEIIAFIKLENEAIMRTGPTVNGVLPERWLPGDHITVCDGSLCLMVQYQAGGVWLPVGGTFKDNGQGYKNANIELKSGGVGDSRAIFRLSIDYTGYLGVQPIPKRIIVDVGPIVPVTNIAAGYSSGPNFSLGFEWGSAGSSDAAASGGGGCRNACLPTKLE
jgi:hypothetical protein